MDYNNAEFGGSDHTLPFGFGIRQEHQPVQGQAKVGEMPFHPPRRLTNPSVPG
jgi:hypothetical protein